MPIRHQGRSIWAPYRPSRIIFPRVFSAARSQNTLSRAGCRFYGKAPKNAPHYNPVWTSLAEIGPVLRRPIIPVPNIEKPQFHARIEHEADPPPERSAEDHPCSIAWRPGNSAGRSSGSLGIVNGFFLAGKCLQAKPAMEFGRVRSQKPGIGPISALGRFSSGLVLLESRTSAARRE